MKTLRLLIPFFLLALATAQPSFQPAPALTLPLREGWTLQSSAKVTATGEAISSASFKTSDWIRADVPTTVVAAQVKQGLLPDPFYGMNLRQYAQVGPASSILLPPSSPDRMCSRCRYRRRLRTTWPSLSWTGVPRPPTRTWGCGVRFI